MVASFEDIILAVGLRISKWAVVHQEVENLCLDNTLYWAECMVCGHAKTRCPPLEVFQKFNVDEVGRIKPGPAGIGVLCNN